MLFSMLFYLQRRVNVIFYVIIFTEEGECYFLPHPTDPHKFINIYGGYEQYCAPGTIFMLEDCKCAHGGEL